MTRVGKRAERVCTKEHHKICAICGLTHEVALEVCHISNNPSEDDKDNLVWLCRTHHRMMDCKMYPTDIVKALRDHWDDWFNNNRQPDHSGWMKDAAVKAAKARSRSAAAKRAADTRRKNQGASPSAAGAPEAD